MKRKILSLLVLSIIIIGVGFKDINATLPPPEEITLKPDNLLNEWTTTITVGTNYIIRSLNVDVEGLESVVLWVRLNNQLTTYVTGIGLTAEVVIYDIDDNIIETISLHDSNFNFSDYFYIDLPLGSNYLHIYIPRNTEGSFPTQFSSWLDDNSYLGDSALFDIAIEEHLYQPSFGWGEVNIETPRFHYNDVELSVTFTDLEFQYHQFSIVELSPTGIPLNSIMTRNFTLSGFYEINYSFELAEKTHLIYGVYMNDNLIRKGIVASPPSMGFNDTTVNNPIGDNYYFQKIGLNVAIGDTIYNDFTEDIFHDPLQPLQSITYIGGYKLLHYNIEDNAVNHEIVLTNKSTGSIYTINTDDIFEFQFNNYDKDSFTPYIKKGFIPIITPGASASKEMVDWFRSLVIFEGDFNPFINDIEEGVYTYHIKEHTTEHIIIGESVWLLLDGPPSWVINRSGPLVGPETYISWNLRIPNSVTSIYTNYRFTDEDVLFDESYITSSTNLLIRYEVSDSVDVTNTTTLYINSNEGLFSVLDNSYYRFEITPTYYIHDLENVKDLMGLDNLLTFFGLNNTMGKLSISIIFLVAVALFISLLQLTLFPGMALLLVVFGVLNYLQWIPLWAIIPIVLIFILGASAWREGGVANG